ncbi:SulP family inorganic anion transporter [Pseudomonadales bacterium]|nr:SulP family inorganic anion transporter [Pseudomonadales bacterium]MDB9867527.1 SulP family inorganic anion transporter [Pseudomonadales bacterium]MDB9880229.1 SulP family inorganic anion transporter [Pseudomonadales bacterium]MDB9917668.1 SulP family inorganic anion transporter [Pseudomonadales bacterium]MDB9942690.1 SulP family inorganic anion transporter [Pseudomonadales bacterium]
MLLKRWLTHLLPVMQWWPEYNGEAFRADLIAGIVVLFITVPQVIAYAFLAGLPAETGLYAAIMALLCYAAFGSCRTLAVGPTAILAIMSLESVSAFETPGTVEYTLLASKLAMVTGGVLVLLRIVNFGAVVSFLSHAVVTGFITAAAILIITNQIPSMLGLSAPPDTAVVAVIQHVTSGMDSLNLAAMSIAIGAMSLLWFCRHHLEALLQSTGIHPRWVGSLVKSAPMYAVILSVAIVWSMGLVQSSDVSVVGVIPNQLPTWAQMDLSLVEIQQLLPSALLMSMVIFMESTSIGAAVASKRREKIEPNQELVGLGLANLGSAMVGGFPVAGSFARTIVNFSSGAVTPVASLVTCVLVVITLVWFAPWFYYLPKAVLSAIIVMSAIQLIDLHGIQKTFQFNRIDSVTFAGTFLAVLGLGVETGILAGIAISFLLLIRSSSKPHIAVVGRVGNTETFRNVLRYEVETSPQVLALRIDESIYFVNTRYIEVFVFNKIADSPAIKHVILICSSANFIDTSGLEMLELLQDSLAEVGVTLHLAEVKGPVMDKLKETEFFVNMKGNVYFSTDVALKDLAEV